MNEAESPPSRLAAHLVDRWALEYLLTRRVVSAQVLQTNREAAPLEAWRVPSPEELGLKALKGVALEEIRRQVECGSIEKAIELLTADFPALLTNTRLIFDLYKQEFLRLNTVSPQDALLFAQTRLATLATAAHPEAQAEFKKSLLMLMYSKDAGRPSPGAPPLGTKRGRNRQDLANSVVTAVLKSLGVLEPKLSLLLRYLILVHNLYTFLRGEEEDSASTTLIQAILLPERDDEEVGGREFDGQNFSDYEINVLAQSAGISPMSARLALSLANPQLTTVWTPSRLSPDDGLVLGSQTERQTTRIEEALRNEVGRCGIGHDTLEVLCGDWCRWRGLRDCTLASPSSISASSYTRLCKYRQAFSHLISTYEARLAPAFVTLSSPFPSSPPPTLLPELLGLVRSTSPDFARSHPRLYFSLLRLSTIELCINGKWANLAAAQEARDDDGLPYWSKAMNQLQRDMSPLSLQHSELLHGVKEQALLVALKYPLLAHLSQVPKHVNTLLQIVTVLFETHVWEKVANALAASPDPPPDQPPASPPQLHGLLNSLVTVHESWFAQQGDEDRFAFLFGLPRLKDTSQVHDFVWGSAPWAKYVGGDEGAKPSRPSSAPSPVPGKRRRTESVGWDEMMADQEAQLHDVQESDIQLLIDMMAMTRVHAINLLIEHGDVNEVLNSIMFE